MSTRSESKHMPRSTSYFTQTEVCWRLDISDPKTLKAWCDQIAPPIQPRKRKGYGNKVWYTGHELSLLARVAEQHGRKIRSIEEGEAEEQDLIPEKRRASKGQTEERDLLDLFSDLEHAQAVLKQQHAALQQHYEELREQVEASLKEYIDRKFEDLQQRLEAFLLQRLQERHPTSPQPVTPSAGTPRPASPQPVTSSAGTPRGEGSSFNTVAGSTRPRDEAYSLSTTRGSAQAKRTYERPDTSKRTPPSQLTTWTPQELYAEGWRSPREGLLVSKARMSKAHNVPDTNVRRDIERNDLQMVPEKHLYDRAWKTGGFNSQQRRRFYELYKGQSWFNPCDLCLLNGHEDDERALRELMQKR